MAIEDIEQMTAPLSAKGGREVAMPDPDPKGIMQLAGGLDAEEMMDRAYKWYHENHIKGIEGFESPLYDEDGIPLIDPSTIFTMFMSS